MAFKIDNKKLPKIYIVLGAPHSATSLIAKGLHDNGIDMNPLNENFEDLEFERVNQKILRKKKYKQGLEKLIKERDKKHLWGWKEPKTSLTLDKYLPYLKNDVYLFCCFRKPSILLKNWKETKHTSGGRKLLDKFNKKLLKNIKKFLEL